MRFNSINYKKDRYPESGIFNRGYWWYVGKQCWHSQIVVGKGVYDLGFHLGLGGTYSETPVDLAFFLPGLSIYLTTTMFGKICEKLTGDYYKPSREISLQLKGKTLNIDLWSKKHEWHSEDPWWVKGLTFNLSPIDKIYGNKRYYYYHLIKSKSKSFVKLPEKDYPVDLTLKVQVFKRPRGKAIKTSYIVEWEGAIPFRNHSWKGDEVLGSAVEVTRDSLEDFHWINEATANIAARIQKDRTRYGYKYE